MSGIEPLTPSLPWKCSTTELHGHGFTLSRAMADVERLQVAHTAPYTNGMPTYSDPSHPQPIPSIRVTSPALDLGPYLTLVGGVLMAAFAAFLFFRTTVAQQKTADTQVQITKAQTTRNSVNTVVTDAVTYNQLGDSLKKLFDGQKLWSATLTNLERNLYRHLAVTSLQFDDKGTMTLSGTTTSYTDYAKIYSSFTDPSVSNVFQNVIPSAVNKDDKGGITFTFTMTLAPSQIKYASSAQ